jgi:hypothetical protein
MPKLTPGHIAQANLFDLVVRQVSALVAATAETLANGGHPEVLRLEIEMYLTLAANCRAKAKSADELMNGITTARGSAG